MSFRAIACASASADGATSVLHDGSARRRQLKCPLQCSCLAKDRASTREIGIPVEVSGETHAKATRVRHYTYCNVSQWLRREL
jgi:hypothetical protein